MTDYESIRLANIERNKALLKQLELNKPILPSPPVQANSSSKPAAKRRKVDSAPTRTSARISAVPRPSYKDESDIRPVPSTRKLGRKDIGSSVSVATAEAVEVAPSSPKSRAEILARWEWEATASLPTRDDEGTLHFDDTPDFLPNKTPEEIIREGCFGGSYFRPLFSKKLGITVDDDYEELPKDWLTNLDISQYLTSSVYQPSINKYKVACGQSIEEWEANGWINHDHDVRGWFQWYLRFYQGRRCDDDERQISRWKKCCGEKGRWRRTLLKKYVSMGVREVFDDGEEEGKEVSPVIHQTCHHWAFEVRQPILDAFWENGA